MKSEIDWTSMLEAVLTVAAGAVVIAMLVCVVCAVFVARRRMKSFEECMVRQEVIECRTRIAKRKGVNINPGPTYPKPPAPPSPHIEPTRPWPKK